MNKSAFPVLATALVLSIVLVGCSSTSSKRSPFERTTAGYLDDETRALLPRTSAKDDWNNRNRALPPLPDSYARTGAADAASPSPPGPDPTLVLEPEPATETAAGLPPALEPRPPAPKLKQVGPADLEALVDRYKGKVLVLNCWGVDCGPCVEELPHLAKLSKEFQKKGLTVAAISTDTESRHPEVEAFVQEQKYPFDVYLRAPGSDTKFRKAISPDYAADPFTIVFARDGRALATVSDALSEEDWRTILVAALDEKPIPITDPEVVRSF